MLLSLLAPANQASCFPADLLQIEETALNADTLEQMRGGFYTDSGMLVKFSFQDIVKVDGEIQAHTIIDIPPLDLLKMQADGTGASFLAEAARIIQTGDGNFLAPQALAGNPGLVTIIQNSLDNKLIQHQKILDIEVSRFNFTGNSWINSRINDRLVDALN